MRLLEELAAGIAPLSDRELARMARKAAATPRRAVGRRRSGIVSAATALLAALGLGFGLGVLLWPSGSSAAGEQPMFGAGFLPADGWRTIQTGLTAIAANVPIRQDDVARGAEAIPRATLATLPRRGVVVVATLEPRFGRAVQRSLPLRLEDAEPVVVADFPARRLRASVDAYDLEVLVFLGSQAALPAAQRQLDRLVVGAEQVTIRARKIPHLVLSGTVASGKAGETIGVELRVCTYDFYRLVGGTQTTDGGVWHATSSSREELGWRPDFEPGIGWYRARWEGHYSKPVLVRWPLTYGYWDIRGRRFIFEYDLGQIGQSLHGKPIDLQRKTQDGRWVRIQRARLVRLRGSRFRVSFVVRTRGLTLRVFVPAKTAAPCFLPGPGPEFRS